jgi:serine/threonine protein kinase
MLDEYYEARQKHPKDAGKPPRVPEPFLWHVFECLSIAGLLLERGVVEGNPMRNWNTIVHRDLRPDNIFFGMPDPERFNRYPTPKLGDFGIAVYAPPSDYSGVIDRLYTPGGAENSCPPEQCHDRMIEEKWEERWLMSSKTNVWVSICPGRQVRSQKLSATDAALTGSCKCDSFNGENYRGRR